MFSFYHSTAIDSIFLHEVRSLRTVFPSAGIENIQKDFGMGHATYNKIMGKEDFIINDIVRKYKGRGSSDAFLRAGPRSDLHFDPTKVRAAVVTCGGLCPGINNVIRELVHALYNLYNAETVFGVRCVASICNDFATIFVLFKTYFPILFLVVI